MNCAYFSLVGVLTGGLSLGADPEAITDRQRLDWVVGSLGPAALTVGVVGAVLDTAANDPIEYGSHWSGFAKRNGLRLSGVATGTVMEAGLGRIWGEDPRYLRAPERPVMNRVGNVIKMTFMATNRKGKLSPAYARYAAIPGSSFLSNTWRPDSNATVDDAVVRMSLGFLSRMGTNAFAEFWPDVKLRLFKRR